MKLVKRGENGQTNITYFQIIGEKNLHYKQGEEVIWGGKFSTKHQKIKK